MRIIRQSGVTLIELVIAIVIIAIAATAILGTFATTVGQSADPMIRHQAVAIAEAYLEEISLKALPFAAVNAIAVFIIAFFPQIVLWLPRFFGY